jgi:hypothetical protein
MERREMSLAQSEDWGFSNRSHRAAKHTAFQTITINLYLYGFTVQYLAWVCERLSALSASAYLY